MSFYDIFFEKIKHVKILKQERGSILVLSVILLPIMFAFLGFGYDLGNIYMHKSRLQNVADAAALAGARAYLDSQTTKNKDEVDGTVDRENGKLAANSTATYLEGRNTPDVYNVGDAQKSKNRDYSKHKAADKAADEYIYRNIVNLGSEVKSDRWSHYAINSDNADPKTFYRVGLYEEVPLYFLPIIKSVSKTQIVRAGAIAVVVPGDTSSGTTIDPQDKTFSIFDNLFTYSRIFDAGQHTENNIVNSGYDGNIVHTYGDGTGYDGDMFYDSTHTNNNGFSWHVYVNKNSGIVDSNIHDPYINTAFQTTEYMNNLLKWLDSEHIDYSGNTFDTLSLNHINKCNTSENQNKYQSEVFAPWCDGNGYQVYKGRTRGTPHIYKDYKCYAYDEDNNDFVYYLGHPVFYQKTNDGYMPFYNDGTGDKLITARIWSSSVNNAMNNVNGDNLEQHENDDKYRKPIVSNVFHIRSTKDNLDININGRINNKIGDTTYTDNTPVYIFIEDTVTNKIQLHLSNNVRPLIIIYNGSKNIELETANNCRATIYAPNATLPSMHPNGSYTGNIIAKNIVMQASGDKTTWIQDNFLEGKYGYTDTYAQQATQAIQERITRESAKLAAAKAKEQVMKEYAKILKISVEDMNDPNWYNLQSYENKKKLFNTWKTLYNNPKYEEFKDLLWPWNGFFDLEVQSGDTGSTSEELRLINFRTDYQDSNQENAVVDPFIFLSLDKPNAY